MGGKASRITGVLPVVTLCTEYTEYLPAIFPGHRSYLDTVEVDDDALSYTELARLLCDSKHNGWECTRAANHAGDHAAHGRLETNRRGSRERPMYASWDAV